MKELVNVNVPKPKGVEEVTAPVEKKKTVGERIIEAEEDALVHEAVKKAHGLGEGGGGQPEESLATQIVTNSMKQQADAVKDMKDNEKELQNELKEATAAVGQMQTVMMQDMLARIEKSQTKLDESARTAQGAGAPMSAFEGYKQVKGELESLVSTIKKQDPAPQHTGMSEATQIKLKELELQQQQVLAQITADNTRAQNQFQLQMAEFVDNKDTRKLEYQDKKKFREDGLQGVTDIVAALGAGMSQGGESGNPGSEPVGRSRRARTSESGEEEAGAYVSSFKCEFCGSEVPVAEGQRVAQCSNPECGAQYTIKAKE